MRHRVPDGDLGVIVSLAVHELLAEIEKRRRAAIRHSHANAGREPDSRYVPTAVRREVWSRDGSQCAFVGLMGRCPERGGLELHHVIPFCEGGPSTVENLQLRCQAHNRYEWESTRT
jgi:5-methylcytosine-specific restriction endonuclease McrA